MDINLITFIISIVSLLISGVVAIFTYRYNRISIRNEARMEHNKLMLEIDQMYIDDPDLWSIYDDHPIGKHVETTPLKRGKKEALVYYYLNYFDIIFDFYHKQIVMNVNDRKDWESWRAFIMHFFASCSLARNLFKESTEWYDEKYATFLADVIQEVETKKGA